MAGGNNGVAIGEAFGGDPIHTGMREGELLGLKWDNVDLECGVLRLRHGLVREGGKTALGELKDPQEPSEHQAYLRCSRRLEKPAG